MATCNCTGACRIYGSCSGRPASFFSDYRGWINDYPTPFYGITSFNFNSSYDDVITPAEAAELLEKFKQFEGNEEDESLWTISEPYNLYNDGGPDIISIGYPHTNGEHYEDTIAEFWTGNHDGRAAAELLSAAQKYFIPLLRKISKC